MRVRRVARRLAGRGVLAGLGAAAPAAGSVSAGDGPSAAVPGTQLWASSTGRARRIDRAALSVARKLTRRSHHILRRLGDQAYAPRPGW
jgi:hypothetical protein